MRSELMSAFQSVCICNSCNISTLELISVFIFQSTLFTAHLPIALWSVNLLVWRVLAGHHAATLKHFFSDYHLIFLPYKFDSDSFSISSAGYFNVSKRRDRNNNLHGDLASLQKKNHLPPPFYASENFICEWKKIEFDF